VTKPWFAAVAVLLFSSSAVQAAEGLAPSTVTQVEATSSELAVALHDIKKTLSTPRTPLAFDNGATASNCAQYSNLLPTSSPDESVRNAEIRAEYLVCDAVRLISSDPFLVGNRLLPAHAAKALFERLDLRSFPSSLRNRADGQSYTLKSLLAPGTVKTTRNAVEIETSEQFFSLQIVGVVRRPVTGGRMKTRPDEWIVWIGDEIKDGNYKSYRTLIVTPPSRLSSGAYTGSIYPAP